MWFRVSSRRLTLQNTHLGNFGMLRSSFCAFFIDVNVPLYSLFFLVYGLKTKLWFHVALSFSCGKLGENSVEFYSFSFEEVLSSEMRARYMTCRLNINYRCIFGAKAPSFLGFCLRFSFVCYLQYLVDLVCNFVFFFSDLERKVCFVSKSQLLFPHGPWASAQRPVSKMINKLHHVRELLIAFVIHTL